MIDAGRGSAHQPHPSKTMDNSLTRLIQANREAQTLLTNYLYQQTFPKGSDCDEVLQILKKALQHFEVYQ